MMKIVGRRWRERLGDGDCDAGCAGDPDNNSISAFHLAVWWAVKGVVWDT
jgi:hypothetical protein